MESLRASSAGIVPGRKLRMDTRLQLYYGQWESLLNKVVVPPVGRTPNNVLLVGEAPGIEEAARGEPFVGKSGEEQEWYLNRHGLSAKMWRRTNVVLEYRKGNPDPTKAEIDRWSPTLASEVRSTNPKLIIAVGRFAARWFLGDSAELEAIHGLPHRAGAFDSKLVHRGNDAVVLPVYHPALGFYDNDARALIDWDYQQIAKVLNRLETTYELGGELDMLMPEGIGYIQDSYLGKEQYSDTCIVTGDGLYGASLYRAEISGVIAIDTEGTPSNPWSIQVSDRPGVGFVLRTEIQSSFTIDLAALQYTIDTGVTVVMHNAMYDIEMCRVMGLNLRRAKIFDTMYAAYLLRTEPQALKLLAWRWCDMKMSSYRDVVGDVGIEKQLNYLWAGLELDIDTPEPRIVHEHDGTSRLYKPQHIHRRIRKILSDWYEEKVDKDGNRTNPRARWLSVDEELRLSVESELGVMPVGTLADIPLRDAVIYSARDADATLRLYLRLTEELRERGLTELMKQGMETLPMFEGIQSAGMPVSRRGFEQLSKQMQGEMDVLQTRISHRYYGDKPFNPGSHKQVGSLLRRRGLEGTKVTSTGAMSTSKESIEHLRYTDEAIADVFDWREHQHTKDTFCKAILKRIPTQSVDRTDTHVVRCNIKTTRTATRRLASSDPNLLAIPIRERSGSAYSLGKLVRDCYVCPKGEIFGAWDLSHIEMRVMAHESQDKVLCQGFRDRIDIHVRTAATIFEIDVEEVDKELHRAPAKGAGFGILYGIQGNKLLTVFQKLGLQGWNKDRCNELIDKWLTVHEGVRDYIGRTYDEVKEQGYVRDHWGMYRYLPGIWSSDKKTSAEAGRIAVSHKIQGGAQGMIQRSMAWLWPQVLDMQDEGLNVSCCLQIHDELVFRFDQDLAQRVNALVMEALVNHCGIELRVPVEAKGHVSDTWGGLK